MDWMQLVLPAVVVGVIVFQMRKTFRQVSGLARKLQDPEFVAKLKAGDREALRRELAGLADGEGLDPDEGSDVLLARWHRAQGSAAPTQPESAGQPQGLRFERAGSWPLFAALGLALLLAFLRFQG
jgi:hypothetical protein